MAWSSELTMWCCLSTLLLLQVATGLRNPFTAPLGMQSIRKRSHAHLQTSIPLREDPNLVRGVLPNGLQYVILPSSAPSRAQNKRKKLEVRFEILAGSTAETDEQVGLAHLTEHVVFMDNPYRTHLIKRGVHTNAFTDFHHTVFTASLSVPHSSSAIKDLPVICDSFRNIMYFGRPNDINDSTISSIVWDDCSRRMQKEVMAILSESNLVNGRQYRHESKVFSALHQDNIISSRLPIGNTKRLQEYTPKDLIAFHQKHYVPENAILYLTGDIAHENISDIEKTIRNAFADLLNSDGGNKSNVSPRQRVIPLSHNWSTNENNKEGTKFSDVKEKLACVAEANPLKRKLPEPVMLKHIHSHNEVTICVFAKQPIEAITSLDRFRRFLMRKILLNALFVRHHVAGKGWDDNNTFVANIEWQDMPRESCAVTAFDISVRLPNPNDNKEAYKKKLEKRVINAFRDIRNVYGHGITSAEFLRSKNMILREINGLNTRASDPNEVMESLMFAHASGHAYLNLIQRDSYTKAILMDEVSDVKTVTIEEVNTFAHEFLHFLRPDLEITSPSAIVISTPENAMNADAIDSKMISDTVVNVLTSSNDELNFGKPTFDYTAKTPNKLIPDQAKEHLFADESSVSNNTGNATNNAPIRSGRLANGLMYNILHSNTAVDKGRMSIRLEVLPSMWRSSNGSSPYKSILTELGVGMLQAGGKMFNKSKEDVELYCIENDISVDISCKRNKHVWQKQASSLTETPCPTVAAEQNFTDGFTVDISGSLSHIESPSATSSLEAFFQLLHGLVREFKYDDETSFRAASDDFADKHLESSYTLESECLKRIHNVLYFPNITNSGVLSAVVNISDVHYQMARLMHPRYMSLTVVTPIKSLASKAEEHIKNYLSSWPALSTEESPLSNVPSISPATSPSPTKPPQHRWRRRAKENARRRRRIRRGNKKVFWLPNGTFPGGWFYGVPNFTQWKNPTHERDDAGRLSHVLSTQDCGGDLHVFVKDAIDRGVGYIAGYGPNPLGMFPGQEMLRNVDVCQNNPLTGFVTMLVMKEIINQRLHRVVRADNQLAYDATFELHSQVEKGNTVGVPSDWYAITVTAPSSPSKIRDALQACRSALGDLVSYVENFSQLSLESIKSSILDDLENAASQIIFWTHIGSLLSPNLSLCKKRLEKCLLEAINEVKIQDVRNMVEKMNFKDNAIACVGISGMKERKGY